MPLHYREEHVEWTYHHRYPSNETPTRQQLQRWDESIFGRYEELLLRIMPEFGIRRTPGNKSTVMLLARVSNGNARNQVRSGCRYFAHVSGIDLTV